MASDGARQISTVGGEGERHDLLVGAGRAGGDFERLEARDIAFGAEILGFNETSLMLHGSSCVCCSHVRAVGANIVIWR